MPRPDCYHYMLSPLGALTMLYAATPGMSICSGVARNVRARGFGELRTRNELRKKCPTSLEKAVTQPKQKLD